MPFSHYTRRTYLLFKNLPTLDPGAVVQTATLSMSGEATNGATSKTIMVYQTGNTSWVESGTGGITWNNTIGETYSWEGMPARSGTQGPTGGCDYTNPAAADVLYLNDISRMNALTGMMAEYMAQSTDKVTCSTNAIYIMLNFINALYGSGGLGEQFDTNTSLDTGIRAPTWLSTYQALVKTSYLGNPISGSPMDATASKALLKYFYQMGNYLNDDIEYPRDTNACLEQRSLIIPATIGE